MTVATTPNHAADVRSHATDIRYRVPIGNLLLDRTDLRTTLGQCCKAIEEKLSRHIVTANLQFLSLARRNRSFAELVNMADLVVADGMPLVWLSKLHGTPLPERITGHDLLHASAALAASRGYSVFLLGGRPGAAESAARRLQALYPGLRIAGTIQGDVNKDGWGATEDIERRSVAAIRDAHPDFLFVALGCPKQEYWIAQHIADIEVPVCMGVGSVLDVLAGDVRRAPKWMQRSGLEWVYRMKQEPLRLGRRYLLTDAPTVMRLGGSSLVRRLTRRRGARRLAPAPDFGTRDAAPQLSPEQPQQ